MKILVLKTNGKTYLHCKYCQELINLDTIPSLVNHLEYHTEKLIRELRRAKELEKING